MTEPPRPSEATWYWVRYRMLDFEPGYHEGNGIFRLPNFTVTEQELDELGPRIPWPHEISLAAQQREAAQKVIEAARGVLRLHGPALSDAMNVLDDELAAYDAERPAPEAVPTPPLRDCVKYQRRFAGRCNGCTPEKPCWAAPDVERIAQDAALLIASEAMSVFSLGARLDIPKSAKIIMAALAQARAEGAAAERDRLLAQIGEDK